MFWDLVPADEVDCVGSIGSARHTLCEAADVVSVGIEPGILVFAAY